MLFVSVKKNFCKKKRQDKCPALIYSEFDIKTYTIL
jgi:hypothetical protein